MFDKITEAVSNTLWGYPMLVLLAGCGMYMSFRLHFIQITEIPLWIRESMGTIFRKKENQGKGITPYQAMTSALASSIGTGNITGVATAISAGGAGAVFWMWVSAIFGMAIKYSEILLAVKFRKGKEGVYFGGPMYYIESGLGKSYRFLAVIFAISASFACLGMGAMSQSNAISSVLSQKGGIPCGISALIIGCISAIAVSGGILRVVKITELLVPFMACAYIIGGISVFFIAPQDVFSAIKSIFSSALMPKAMYGGIAGEMVRKAIRFGVSRGVFSNEAGLGSSPLVHASADTESPSSQGFWGIFEVFVDTIIVCSVTAVVVISAGDYCGEITGAALVAGAFEKYFGSFGSVFVGIATVLFALSTILGWSCYGERCVGYLSKESVKVKKLYRWLFVVSVMFGAILEVESVWQIADMFNGMMMIPNLIAVFLLADVVVSETEKKLKRRN